jgi:hypothetical protein
VTIIGIVEIYDNLPLKGKPDNSLIAGGCENGIFEIA